MKARKIKKQQKRKGQKKMNNTEKQQSFEENKKCKCGIGLDWTEEECQRCKQKRIMAGNHLNSIDTRGVKHEA